MTQCIIDICTQGPVSVGIDARGSEFQHYSSGVYNNPDCDADKIDHGVSSDLIIRIIQMSCI